ncbi:hypothetical protein ABAC460_02610 [Asticcacaulis sp. AC460]|uniref:hypothetical protein n=1 Tax=Asticcacaulis sp. AC460 TaxID=1282360 RepID=UPI0003C3B243|nr:hypothetical protein [Asticcacaulis sp. AC460]ESQ92741.1 hypothetical protein ABAC460_02610 [Asticcacaulis sp. AC460]
MYKHITLAAWLVLAACQPAPHSNTASTASDAPDCAKLPESGLCYNKAIYLLQFDSGSRPNAPDGCTWTLNETALPQGEYLLYLAALCDNKATKLDYGNGTLRYRDFPDSTPVTIIPATPDGHTAILDYAKAKITDPKEAARCKVRRAAIDSFPADALEVDEMTIGESEKIATEGIRTACGPFGLDQDSQRYWRIISDHALFFDLGQDSAPFDPGSLTIYRPQTASSS